jgi:hypothetical protein
MSVYPICLARASNPSQRALFVATAKASGATARGFGAKRIFLMASRKGSYPKSLNRVGKKDLLTNK